MRIYYHTFGCKANQYDTERMRQELEERGSLTVRTWSEADVCVVNTCTVTNRADADARRFIRRLGRARPHARVVVAGCSAALRAPELRALREVSEVVPGHDPGLVAQAATRSAPLVQLGDPRTAERAETSKGRSLLKRRHGATRGWLKVQDGCDRQCSFCATRLARGPSRSRPPEEVVAEARLLSTTHPELVVTGIHIGHYGHDLLGPWTLSRLLERLLEAVPNVRFRLGSVEATEVDDLLVEQLVGSGGRVAPHLHMPLQSGSDSVLRRMRRWHTRGAYRERALEIAALVPVLGLGADIITGFPGETDRDHQETRDLVDELPFTYLHVFPFSPRAGTVASRLKAEDGVPERIAAERSRDLRQLAAEKTERYRASRAGDVDEVTLERRGERALTGDYLRIGVISDGRTVDPHRLHRGRLTRRRDDLHIDLTRD